MTDIEMAAIYDTLVRYDPVTLKYEPQTAESVTSNADSTEWTIKLRPNIKFSDGTDYDADAVVFGLNRFRGGVPGGQTGRASSQYSDVIVLPSGTLS